MMGGVVFLLGVDNTLLYGDRIVDDLREHQMHAQRSPWAITTSCG